MKQVAVVEKQFGETAQAYLASCVHAQGDDLVRLRAMASRHPQARILDLGCGGGHVSFAVAPVAATVIACDVTASMLAVVASEARQRDLHNVITERAQAESLPFEDACFDMVITRFSAHHWSDVQAGLREAFRVLRDGGVMVVVDIVAPELPLLDTTLQAVEILRDPSHVRDYRVSEWMGMFHAAGFQQSEPLASVAQWKLMMVFADWIARMRTPPERVTAIRSLFAVLPDEVRRYFGVQQDDSFAIDAAFFEVRKPGA